MIEHECQKSSPAKDKMFIDWEKVNSMTPEEKLCALDHLLTLSLPAPLLLMSMVRVISPRRYHAGVDSMKASLA